MFKRVSIVGLGLIGGSLGMALKRGRIARSVIGFSRHERTIRRALARGAVNDADTELCPDWLGESDLVVIATPPLTVVPIAREIARLTTHRFVMTDVASTKAQIVRQLERSLPARISFVGSHPMAGSEKSGIEAAHQDLFNGAPCVVTRTSKTNRAALARVSALWRSVGGRPMVLDPSRHDALVARVSHLPHLTAVGLMLAAGKEPLILSAGGFADTTRIALSDPRMWREICLSNRKQITRALRAFRKEIERFEQLIRRGDGAALSRLFASAQRKRRGLTK